MIRIVPGAWRHIQAVALAVLAIVVLASCGSGGVTDNTVTSGGALAVTPSTATLYSDLPTTFIVSGGTGSYVILSSDQNVVPVASTLKGSSFVVVPTEVAADTPVTLTVRDAQDGTLTPVSATLTVKPRTVSNVVTITPSASQSAACGTAVCSGGDAEVKVMLSQGGVPLVGRDVRFDVVSGDVRIITSPPGAVEEDSLSGSATTDSSGTARVRVRVLADAVSQTALLQVTDISSGFTQRTAVTIAPSSNAPLNALPNTISFRSDLFGQCPSGLQADVIIFGGHPPYLISQPGTFDINPTTVAQSGGRFTVTAIGQCTEGSQIAVVDANGASTVVTASSTTPLIITPPTTPAFVVSPTAVTLDSCAAVANVVLAGGSGAYFGASGNSALLVNVAGNTASITRQDAGPGPFSSPISVAFSDGSSAATVSVSLSGAAAGQCP